MLMSLNKGEQLSMAVTASAIWLYAYVRYWPVRPWVGVFVKSLV